jgi:general secretion pathway protein G
MNTRTAAERGFTLIEIMVVVVIIGLLVGFAGPRIWAMLAHGQEEIALAKCKEYHDAVSTWKMVKKKTPETLQDMAQPLKPGEDNFIRVEEDPWGNPYQMDRDGNKVRVYSYGPDGVVGTDDDIQYPKREE